MGLKRLPFTKMHGTGNDFVVVRAGDIPEGKDPAAIARTVSHRRFGVGSDGLLIVGPERGGADLEMVFHNPDGSLAEMCGNGLRCVAKYAYDRGLVEGRTQFSVLTGGGIKPVDVTVGAEGKVYAVECDMGTPVFGRGEIPVGGEGDEAIDEDLEFQHGDHRHQVRFTAVSMGNPHIVILHDNVDDLKVSHLGPALEAHPLFPQKTNVEFVQRLSPDRVKVRIWERGAGETWSCGTGICAVFAALHRLGHCGDHLVVEVKGGEVETRFGEGGHILKKGPAVEVFSG
ncbi:MAG TPA: diaminopimelate epimerase, partial [bacterium]|nr:diaminopimelate epimerase [bacterium]